MRTVREQLLDAKSQNSGPFILNQQGYNGDPADRVVAILFDFTLQFAAPGEGGNPATLDVETWGDACNLLAQYLDGMQMVEQLTLRQVDYLEGFKRAGLSTVGNGDFSVSGLVVTADSANQIRLSTLLTFDNPILRDPTDEGIPLKELGQFTINPSTTAGVTGTMTGISVALRAITNLERSPVLGPRQIWKRVNLLGNSTIQSLGRCFPLQSILLAPPASDIASVLTGAVDMMFDSDPVVKDIQLGTISVLNRILGERKYMPLSVIMAQAAANGAGNAPPTGYGFYSQFGAGGTGQPVVRLYQLTDAESMADLNVCDQASLQIAQATTPQALSIQWVTRVLMPNTPQLVAQRRALLGLTTLTPRVDTTDTQTKGVPASVIANLPVKLETRTPVMTTNTNP